MEKFKDYLTKEGWKRDWKKIKEDKLSSRRLSSVYPICALTIIALGLGGFGIYNSINQDKYRKSQDKYRKDLEIAVMRQADLHGKDPIRRKDRCIDFYEKADAFRRMGYDNLFIEGEKFPIPTKEELKRALESYHKE